VGTSFGLVQIILKDNLLSWPEKRRRTVSIHAGTFKSGWKETQNYTCDFSLSPEIKTALE
jgi:hypothetical protein